MTLRTPILAAALFTSVAALGLSHSMAHAAPPPGHAAPATAHAAPATANPRLESTFKGDDGTVTICPPWPKPVAEQLQPIPQPGPNWLSRGTQESIPQPIPWNYFENYSEQFGFGDRYKSHAHDHM